jgi:hypothetical protein
MDIVQETWYIEGRYLKVRTDYQGRDGIIRPVIRTFLVYRTGIIKHHPTQTSTVKFDLHEEGNLRSRLIDLTYKPDKGFYSARVNSTGLKAEIRANMTLILQHLIEEKNRLKL